MSVLSKLAQAIDSTAVFGNARHLHSTRLPTNVNAGHFEYLATDGSVDGTSYLRAGGSAGTNGQVTFSGNRVTYGGNRVTYGV